LPENGLWRVKVSLTSKDPLHPALERQIEVARTSRP